MLSTTVDMMRKEWGSNAMLGDIKVQYEPFEFLAKEIMRDVPGRRLTWYRTSAIEKAVLKHIPDIENNRPSRRIPKGSTFRSILDGLKMVPSSERTPKLNSCQKETQAKI